MYHKGGFDAGYTSTGQYFFKLRAGMMGQTLISEDCSKKMKTNGSE